LYQLVKGKGSKSKWSKTTTATAEIANKILQETFPNNIVA